MGAIFLNHMKGGKYNRSISPTWEPQARPRTDSVFMQALTEPREIIFVSTKSQDHFNIFRLLNSGLDEEAITLAAQDRWCCSRDVLL